MICQIVYDICNLAQRAVHSLSSGDKERMRTMITWLGFRHVKYGVRPHHIPIMGQVGAMYYLCYHIV
jgi:hypothetical protein